MTSSTAASLKRVKLAVLFLLLSLPTYAQLTLRGRVVNAADEQPVPFASVFLANTNKGTTADGEGRFTLANVPTGRYELVASSVGFEAWAKLSRPMPPSRLHFG
jgi:hypothetical protein